MGGNHQTNDNNNQIQSIQLPTYISSNMLLNAITPPCQSQGVNRKILRVDQNLAPKRTSKYL